MFTLSPSHTHNHPHTHTHDPTAMLVATLVAEKLLHCIMVQVLALQILLLDNLSQLQYEGK